MKTLAAVVACLLLPIGCAVVAASTAPAAAEGPGTTTAGSSSSCTRRCGNMSIPYPFGVEPGCYHAAGFNVTCKQQLDDASSWKLFIGDGTVQALEISVPNGTVRINSSRVAFSTDSAAAVNGTWGVGLPAGGPYFLSKSNSVTFVGCGVQVNLHGGGRSSLVSSCVTVCPPSYTQDGVFSYIAADGACGGVGCCQANIDVRYSFYEIQIFRMDVTAYSPLPAPAIYIGDRDFNYSKYMHLLSGKPRAVPATLDWVINNSTCPTTTNTTSSSAPECSSAHSACLNKDARSGYGGYQCYCLDGYQGNPYVPDGCQDIDECKSPDVYLCYGDCQNTQGSFICRCPPGYTGNGTIPHGCKDVDECEQPQAHSCYGSCLNFPGSFQCQCPSGTYGNPFTQGGCISFKNSVTGLSIGLGVGGGTSILLLSLGVPFIIRKLKQRKAKKVKKEYFRQNHGLLLQKLISQNTDIGGRMIITLSELEKATNNFDRARVVGGGGHGVVFKGILDLQVVAIKKPKIVVQREIKEFINEVVVLSKVNHRNVVKLLGCCLEAEVPLLVYEFISNGTLCDHLHVEGQISLSWKDRIRIALEVARAISYLHSSTSIPIFHRDIKSSNILLDDSLTAKVSDFGASRYVPIDQPGITTAVQGTIGYLDPMYFYTGRLIDKSDVFSFGVLLIELLTRKKPFHYPSNDGGSLVEHFARLLAQGNLVGIIDPQVMDEEDGELQEVAIIALVCTKVRLEDRPTMREVEMSLENLLAKKQQVPCIMEPRTNEDGTLAQYMQIEQQITNEGSRQYTMEKEILLSASYPR